MENETVLNILKLILAGSPLSEVLTIIARVVESRGAGTLCTIWLPDDDGKQLHCAAAPSLVGFSDHVGSMLIGPKGGSCGTAVYRKKPVYVTDILNDPIWDHYRHLLLPYGIRAVWSQPLFTSDGKVLGTFAIHYREARSPDATDLQLIENAGHIAGIAIERHLNEEKLRYERDRLRLLLEITSSVTSRLDLRQVVEVLSTNLFRIMQCDVSALLLPDSESGELRVTNLHNPDARGPICEGSLVPMNSSISGQVLRKGKSIRIDSFEQVREDPEIYGNPDGQLLYKRVIEEGLSVGCYLPLLGRDRVVGVLMLCRRSDNAFEKDDVIMLEQVARQIAIAVENTLEYEKATKDRDKETKQRRYLEEEIRAEFGAIVGDSPALKTALNLVSVVAPTGSSVLIMGETGTGKELIARAIHNLSGRRERAFVKLNCAAIPLGLLESELFGHEKGAFTGAIAQKTGRFELANKGTLFLDEVGDIPLELQAKLLRVLQEQEFERLGSNYTHKVDVRVIAATHRDLAAMVAQGTFREDLYYRLKVFPIHVPALRQRTEDVPELVRHFVQLYARRMNKGIDEIPSATMDALVRYRWPGNVRELQNFIERAVILSPHTVLRAPISELEPFSARRVSNAPITGLEELERDHILRALEASNWVVGGRNGAAERLGMKRTSFVYKMQKFRINRPASLPQKSAERQLL
ncbi:sigma 54-interacting transcriptional regulator [Alloacidobacterium dinghuense]|uniref:Sigma 54-interacting transcriptional regulator n=1 Tax=Alloacidobacterium dinghuense TaxID=2763107 RepID=A0A7G8BKR2_9BACT|nr:sigma 54-interacting transcriptional regulator [Alloacidobacterium dinghuense]QNI33132.1 sigma 54-interacting transcriptional regulator [Alloacidobacterium dinghuense]